MKILLVHSEKDEENIEKVHRLIGKITSAVDFLSVQSQDSMSANIKKQFASLINPAGSDESEKMESNGPTHALIVSPIAERWLDFLAGFSYGAHFPLLVYGEKAIAAVPVEFASFFRFLKTEKSFFEYFEAENEAYEKWQSANEIIKARDTLLQMGIPVNGESLAHCAAEGGVREVSLFLAAGFSPDTRNKAGIPLINIAARNGNRDILKLLVKSGAELNAQSDDRGASALFDSVLAKRHDIAADLISAGADVDIKSKDCQTALIVAVGAGDEKMVSALLQAGANPDIPDKMGVNARKYIALFHNSAIMSLLDKYAPQKA